MSKAVYPGSFDPFTNGHLDVTERTAAIFDEVIVAILINPDKHAMFSVEERTEMTREAVAHLPNVTVKSFEGLLVDFMRNERCRVIIRGLRALSDFEYEFQIAQLNRQLAPENETFFVVTSAQYSYLSSRSVKEVSGFGGDISDFVPPCVLRRMNERKASS